MKSMKETLEVIRFEGNIQTEAYRNTLSEMTSDSVILGSSHLENIARAAAVLNPELVGENSDRAILTHVFTLGGTRSPLEEVGIRSRMRVGFGLGRAYATSMREVRDARLEREQLSLTPSAKGSELFIRLAPLSRCWKHLVPSPPKLSKINKKKLHKEQMSIWAK